MRLVPENTIAICIDYQEKLMPNICESESVLKQAEILIKGLKTLGVPVVVTQQYTKGLGKTVEPVHSALGEYEPFEKLSFGAYDDPDIKLHARSSHHEGRKPAGVVDWRRTVQGRFFYAAMSALIKLVSCSPVEPQIVQPGSGKRTHSKVKP